MGKRHVDSIIEQLENRIFDGTFSGGDRLDETRLAEQFSVSRTPLREALQRLAQSGLVKLIPRRGAFVQQPGLVELIEMFEVMAEIEAACGRFAAKRISNNALSELHDANERCQVAVEAQEPDIYYTENAVFHRIIYRESGNNFLENEARILHRRLQPFRRQQLRLRGRMAQSLSEHRAILEALERGDSEAAADILRGHVVFQGERFYSLMAVYKDVAK